MTATSHIPTGSMSKRGNVRDRQLRRWGLRTAAVDRRNGVSPEGYDPRGVSQILPWCVEAYLARGPITPRMSTRRYRTVEWQNAHSGGSQSSSGSAISTSRDTATTC